jgi:hypothetical protein
MPMISDPQDDDMPTTEALVRGFSVTVINTRPDIDTGDVLDRLDASLALIETFSPHYFRHMRRDFARILVQRYACRGAYFPWEHTCMVELTFTVNRDFTPTQVAATILHEAAHARLHRLGFSLDMGDRARQERFCRRAEIEFGQVAPDGGPVIERALATLQFEDEEVAPLIDERLAAERIVQVDREALERRIR